MTLHIGASFLDMSLKHTLLDKQRAFMTATSDYKQMPTNLNQNGYESQKRAPPISDVVRSHELSHQTLAVK